MSGPDGTGSEPNAREQNAGEQNAGEQNAGDPNGTGRRATEEAIRLLQTLTEFTGAHDAPECRICPLCQLLVALRQVRPEAVEHLVRASAEFAAALRDLAAPSSSDAHPEPQDVHPESPNGGPAAPRPASSEAGRPGWRAPAAARPKVQRIDVTD
jgi:hypothetical protein